MIAVTDTAAALDEVIARVSVVATAAIAALSVLAAIIARLRDALDRVRREAAILRESVRSMAHGVEEGKGDLVRVLSDRGVADPVAAARAAHDALCARVQSSNVAAGTEVVVAPLVREAKRGLAEEQ